MLRSVAMLMVGPVAPFEAATICEVFGIDRTEDGVPPIDFRTCGPVAGEPLPTRTGGLQIVPAYGLDGLEGADLVAVAATPGREFPEEALAALRRAHAAGALLTEVAEGEEPGPSLPGGL